MKMDVIKVRPGFEEVGTELGRVITKYGSDPRPIFCQAVSILSDLNSILVQGRVLELRGNERMREVTRRLIGKGNGTLARQDEVSELRQDILVVSRIVSELSNKEARALYLFLFNLRKSLLLSETVPWKGRRTTHLTILEEVVSLFTFKPILVD